MFKALSSLSKLLKIDVGDHIMRLWLVQVYHGISWYINISIIPKGLARRSSLLREAPELLSTDLERGQPVTSLRQFQSQIVTNESLQAADYT